MVLADSLLGGEEEAADEEGEVVGKLVAARHPPAAGAG